MDDDLHRDSRDDKTAEPPQRPRSARPSTAPAIEVGELQPLIPQGRYQATGGRSSIRKVFGRLKVVVEWTVLLPDDSRSRGVRRVVLLKFYNVEEVGPGRFRAPPCGDYLRDWIYIARRRPSRRDRLSPGVFTGAFCEVEVVTVTRNRRQHLLSEDARYSKIGRLVTHLAGGGRR
jgi:hypothetical protein